MPVAGNVIRELYLYLDNQGAPAGGMTSPADVTLNLFQDTGAGFALVGGNAGTGITVSWAAVSGSTGYYTVSYTPTSNGAFVLEVIEINASASGARWKFPQEVTASGAVFVPSYSNAFCSEGDIERWLQQPITSSSKPTDTETAAFAENRATMLMSLCARLGFTVTPSTVTSGSRLQDLLREANAIGAAMDYTIAQSFGTGPSKTGRAEWLEGLWKGYFGSTSEEIVGILEMEIGGNLASLATDHILSGDTIAATVTTPTDLGIQVTMGDIF